jgi:hypothetical protein
MRLRGFEPPRAFAHRHLKTARLPFRHSRVNSKDSAGSQDFRPPRTSIAATASRRLIRIAAGCANADSVVRCWAWGAPRRGWPGTSAPAGRGRPQTIRRLARIKREPKMVRPPEPADRPIAEVEPPQLRVGVGLDDDRLRACQHRGQRGPAQGGRPTRQSRTVSLGSPSWRATAQSFIPALVSVLPPTNTRSQRARLGPRVGRSSHCYADRRSPPSSRGLGRRPLTAETGVRIPVAVPLLCP